jgi:hypothetical protein
VNTATPNRVALTGLRPPGLPHHPAYGSDSIENGWLPTRSASEAFYAVLVHRLAVLAQSAFSGTVARSPGPP